MATSPQRDSDGVLRIAVKSNGRSIADSIQLASVHIRRSVAGIPTARLVILDGDMATGTWPVADGETFKPGAIISIAAGYGSGEQTVFEGIVVKLGMRIGGNNDNCLVVDCRHEAVKMTVGRKNANYADQTDSAIIERIFENHGLPVAVDTTTQTHSALAQYHCTDWDFVVARAEVNGLMVIAEDDKVLVQAPRTTAEPVLCLGWGIDLMEFDAEVDSQSQWQSVQAVAWDPKTQAVCRGSEARIRGRMKFQGSALAKVGSLIEVKNVGARYSGTVFVGAVEHAMEQGQWVTTVEFGLASQWICERTDAVAPAAAGWLPGAEGLQIGVVTRLDGDPAGEQRIQIKLPVLEASTPTVWARVAQFHASNGFGAFFLPEVGDEVVVGFFNHDPSHPVVLGSLYSSHNRPAYPLAASNDSKALLTRCGHQLEFNEKDKIITVTTPANNRVVLSDKDPSVVLQDQSGNRVELNGSGITFDSLKDLTLSAKGRICIDAFGDVSISSKADVKCAGLNVACEAQVGFSGKGNATAELSASGQTTVKGAMVMIN